MVQRFLKTLVQFRGAGWTFAFVLAGLLVTAGSALAVGPGGGGGGGGVGGTGGQAVPEISASAAVSALTLLTGGTLILVDRMRRRAR